MRKVAGLVLAVRIDDGQRGRQRLAAQVVIEDDNITPCRCNGSVRQRAAIDAKDHVMRLPQCLHGGHIRTVAFVDAVGDVDRGHVSKVAQPDLQQGRGSPAIDIVIGKDRDPFAPLQGGQKPRRRLVHVAQGQGIGQQIAQDGVQERRRLIRVDLPRRQRLAQRQGQPRRLNDRLGQPFAAQVGADPSATRDRVCHVKKRARCHGLFMPNLT